MKSSLFSALACAALLAAPTTSAAPFAAADPPAGATHCVFTIDSLAPTVVTVGVVAPYTCKTDVGAVAVGPHTVKVRARRVDPVWGDVDSVDTAPLPFTKPGPLAVPTGLTLTP